MHTRNFQVMMLCTLMACASAWADDTTNTAAPSLSPLCNGTFNNGVRINPAPTRAAQRICAHQIWTKPRPAMMIS